jgi:intergrase/recombinase
MKSIIDYLDDCKRKTGSDNKTAQSMDIERTTIANIRKRGQMSDETAIKIAELLKIDPSEILLAATIARSEGAVKTAWEKISKRTGIAAGIILAVNTALPSVEAHYEGKSNGQGMYIMLNHIL